MVKSKKKLGNFSINNKKTQNYSQKGGSTMTTSGNFRLGSDTLGKSLKSMRILQDSAGDTKVIISAVKSSRYGTSTGASNYNTYLNFLINIRKRNIDEMIKIIDLLNNPDTSIQKKAINNMRTVLADINQKNNLIQQTRNNIKSSFENVSVEKNKKQSESFNILSTQVHLTRTKILVDILSLVKNETLELRNLLSNVLNNISSGAMRNTTN